MFILGKRELTAIISRRGMIASRDLCEFYEHCSQEEDTDHSLVIFKTLRVHGTGPRLSGECVVAFTVVETARQATIRNAYFVAVATLMTALRTPLPSSRISKLSDF